MKTAMKLMIIALFGLMSAMWLGCGQAPAGNNTNPSSPNQLPGQPPVCGAPTDSQVCVIVDYRRTLSEMIQAGNYDKIMGSEYLTETNFPIQRPSVGGPIVKVELILVYKHLDKTFDAGRLSGVVQYFDAHPELRYARIEELLALGEQYPNFQPKSTLYSFISLGAFFDTAPDGHHYLSYIGHYYSCANNNCGAKLGLGSQYWEPGMPGYGEFDSYGSIFPAVRK